MRRISRPAQSPQYRHIKRCSRPGRNFQRLAPAGAQQRPGQDLPCDSSPGWQRAWHLTGGPLRGRIGQHPCMRQITRLATSMAGAGRRTGQLAAVGDLAHHDVPAVLEPDAAHVGADMVPHLARLQPRRDLHAGRSQRRASLAAHAEQLPRQLMLCCAACSSHTQRVAAPGAPVRQ